MISYSIIAAISDRRVIGKDNKMPWHVPEDLKLFKRLTTGNIIIMGRKTFESIGKALPGRTTIVITRSPDNFNSACKSENLIARGSFGQALSEARNLAVRTDPPRRIFIAGGASIYALAINGAERLYLSRISGEFDGDTFFPDFNGGGWVIDSTENFDSFRLEIYRRK